MEKPLNNQKDPWYKTWWVLAIFVVGGIVLLGFGFFSLLVFNALQEIKAGTPEFNINSDISGYISDNSANINVKGKPFFGNPDAKVVIIRFCDFECPSCKEVNDAFRTTMLQHENDTLFVHFNYPNDTIHPNAEKAAEAALCADEQGKFWEYQDMLFMNQDKLKVTSLKQYAESVGIDQTQFDACLDSGKKEEDVLSDLVVASQVGVAGTPTFFINGYRVAGVFPETFFQKAIEYFLTH